MLLTKCWCQVTTESSGSNWQSQWDLGWIVVSRLYFTNISYSLSILLSEFHLTLPSFILLFLSILNFYPRCTWRRPKVLILRLIEMVKLWQKLTFYHTLIGCQFNEGRSEELFLPGGLQFIEKCYLRKLKGTKGNERKWINTTDQEGRKKQRNERKINLEAV